MVSGSTYSGDSRDTLFCESWTVYPYAIARDCQLGRQDSQEGVFCCEEEGL